MNALTIETATGLDQEWDSFVAVTNGGHHVQTSMWGLVKESDGAEVLRVKIREDGVLVGGGQVIFSRFPVLGKGGYVSRGPVVSDPRSRRDVIEATREETFARGAKYFAIQPPITDMDMEGDLAALGFRPSVQPLSTPASTRLDLSLSIEELLGNMHKKTRYNVRLAGRRGATVREGGETDLAMFCDFLRMTSERQSFPTYPDSYYETMWRTMAPRGHLRFTVVEYEGEPLAAQFAIPFGDTVLNKLGVWSGKHGDKRPNELIHWDTITWAKANGYRWYDFEGIDLPLAERILTEGGPGDYPRCVSTFKAGFGGRVDIFPRTFLDSPNRFVRGLTSGPMMKALEWKIPKRTIASLRTAKSWTRKSADT